MAEEGLKDFTVNWILGGFLMFCLLAFAISFMLDNNPTGLDGDGTGQMFDNTNNNLSTTLTATPDSADNILNVTSNTNPEVSDLGSRDSVSASFEAKGSATTYWENSKTLISWVFSGTIGSLLLGVIGGLMGFLSLFYIWRFIRSGS